MEPRPTMTLAEMRETITAQYTDNPNAGSQRIDDMHVRLLRLETDAVIDGDEEGRAKLQVLASLAESRSWYWLGVAHERARAGR